MAGHGKSNVSKKDPIIYGEYLVSRMKEENVTQTQLASVLGENRTELGRYVKIGKWSADFKSYISENKEKISNTHLIKAARDFKGEEQASDYIKNIIRQACTVPTPIQAQSQNLVKPIRNDHMLDCLINENRKLESEICDLKECIISLNKKVSSLPSLEGCQTEKPRHDLSEEKDRGDTGDTQKQCIDWRAKIRDAVAYILDLRFTAMSAILWICLIPVTAMFIEHCLESFSFDRMKYLSSVPLTSLALLLACTVDLLIFQLLKLDKWFARVCGGALILLNCFGAYYISGKNESNLAREAIQRKLLMANQKVETLESNLAELYSDYLLTKWPDQTNPAKCESQEIDCGLPYSTAAKNKFSKYISEKQIFDSANSKLSQLETMEASYIHISSNDIYWHLGYYVFLWFLLVLVMWIKQSTLSNRKVSI